MRKCRILLCIPLLAAVLLTSCDSSGESAAPGQSKQDGSSGDDSAADNTPLRDNTPKVLVPTADGTVTYSEDKVTVDASHTDQGYIMVQYSGSELNETVQISSPDGSTYTYTLGTDGNYDVFPLSCGNGDYTIKVYNCVDASSGLYAEVFSQAVSVTVSDEFLPFLYPNQYVDFQADSKTVAKAQELAKDAHSDLDVLEAVFYYIADNVSYDNDKAATVSYGYLPDVDSTLSSGTGICFDYAALMTAMLRSQGIPSRLEIGYIGDIYHAWISAYLDESGWIENVIQFDGTSWELIDPTYAASTEGTEAVDEKDGTYLTKFYY